MKKIILNKQWIGIDLDETLVDFDYEKWIRDNSWIGEPIPHMVKLIRDLHDKGFWVKLFIARASDPQSLPAVKKWMRKAIGYELEITNVKNQSCGVIIDDRAYNCKEGRFTFDDDIIFESMYPEKVVHMFKQNIPKDPIRDKLYLETVPFTFDEYQKLARETAQYPAIGKEFVYPALGLAGETGEVLEKIKKIFRDKDGIISDNDKKELKKELGDVLWYLANLAYDLNLSLEDVAKTNIEKLQSRKNRNVIQGSGDNR